MKATGMGTAGEGRILRDIRDILLRIEEHLLREKKQKEVEVKKQLLND